MLVANATADGLGGAPLRAAVAGADAEDAEDDEDDYVSEDDSLFDQSRLKNRRTTTHLSHLVRHDPYLAAQFSSKRYASEALSSAQVRRLTH